MSQTARLKPGLVIPAVLILLASAPLAAHAIARAAHRAGIRPTLGRLGDELEQRNRGGE